MSLLFPPTIHPNEAYKSTGGGREKKKRQKMVYQPRLEVELKGKSYSSIIMKQPTIYKPTVETKTLEPSESCSQDLRENLLVHEQ